MNRADKAYLWSTPRFDPPGLLVGPLPYKRSPSGCWVPNYNHPGVAQRIRVEVDFVEDILTGRRH